MKTTRRTARAGFTLIEMSVAILLGLAISGMTLGLFQQQLTFLQIYKSQSFLSEEAPIVGMYVSKLVGKADRFGLHTTLAEAVAGNGANNGPSDFAVLKFRQPGGAICSAVLAFQNIGGRGVGLYYYVIPTNGVVPAPQWAVMRPAAVGGGARGGTFTVVGGVLTMTLTGENNEVITYSGST